MAENTLTRFDKIFGITNDIKIEKSRCVQRINQMVFKTACVLCSDERELFRWLCLRLGENADDIIQTENRGGYSWSLIIPDLRVLSHDDFTNTLRIVCLLYEYFQNQHRGLQQIEESITAAPSLATVDIGILWKDGMFYPSGAKELDEQLIEEAFGWLDSFPEEKRLFSNALEEYLHGKLDAVLYNCYLVLEGLVRKILDNDRTLDKNVASLLTHIKLSQEWKSILERFLDYAHEYSRHASSKRSAIEPAEVEAFLYMTGLLVRLVSLSRRTPVGKSVPSSERTC